MADIERTIAVIFSGTDQLSATVNSIAGGLDKFGLNVQKVTQPLADMSDRVIKLEASLAALAIGGLAVAVKNAAEFQTGFAEINTLIADVPTDKIAAFKEEIQTFAAESTASFGEVNKSIYDAISAGIDYGDAVGFMSEAEQLAIGTKSGLNDAVNLLVPTLNAFGKTAADAGDFADILFATVKAGKTTLTELAAPLAQVTGLANSAGLSFDQVGAAIAGLTASGLKTPEAITSLKAALSNIIKPTGEAEKAAEALGIKFDQAALSSMGLEGFLQMVMKATGGNVTEMGKLFGSTEALNGVMILGKDEAGKYASALEGMADRAGGAQSAFELLNFTVENQVKILMNQLDAALIAFGEPFLDKVAYLAQSTGFIFESLTESINAGTFDPIIEVFNTFIEDVADTLNQASEHLPAALAQVDFSEFIDSIKDLGSEVSNALTALFGEVDLTTPEGIAKAIQKVVDSITFLTNVTSGIVSSWEPFLEGLRKGAEGLLNTDAEAQKFGGTILGVGKAINEVIGHVGFLTDGLSALSYGIGGGSLLKGIAALVTSLGEGGAVAVGAGGLIGAFATAGLAAVGFFANLESWFGGGQSAGETISQVLDEFVPGLQAMAEGFSNAAKEILGLETNSTDYWNTLGLTNQKVDEARLTQAAYSNTLRDTPAEVLTKVDLANIESAKNDLGLYSNVITELDGSDIRTEVKAVADVESAKTASAFIVTEVMKHGELVTIVKANPDYKSIQDTKAAVDTIPTEKLLAIKLQGEIDKDIAQIKADAATVQAAVEWKAKLDIAEAEAAAEKFIAASNDINEMFQNTGDQLDSLFSVYAGTSGIKALNVSDWIEAESKRRDDLLKLETKLVESEIALQDAKTSAIERGDSLITVTADGLEPEIEAFVWKILERIQIKAAEDDAALLLGSK